LSTGIHSFEGLRATLEKGDAVQSGPVFFVTVNNQATNTVQVSEGGAGTILVAWNGGPVHSFDGIATTVVHAEKARNDQITFSLIGELTAAPAKSTGPVLHFNASNRA